MRGRRRGWRREETARRRTDVDGDGDGDLFPSDVRALRCLLAGFQNSQFQCPTHCKDGGIRAHYYHPTVSGSSP
uniref:Uncharacterized protein n=1 Tax=Leersia perrieri TaxID=77586 RepID=A0A0D9VP14_9ORYZ